MDAQRRLDHAQQTAKLFITLAVLVILLPITFLTGGAREADDTTRTVLFVAWGVMALSILLGAATLTKLIGGATDPERSGAMAPELHNLVSLQVWSFIAGLGGTIYFAIELIESLPSEG